MTSVGSSSLVAQAAVGATATAIRVHRIALDPTGVQEEHFRKAAGIARFAWNWALGEWQRLYAEHKADPSLPRPNEASLRKALNAIKGESFPWMSEVSKSAPQQAIKNLGAAFQKFWSGAGYPRFKSKNRSRDSFRMDNGPNTFQVKGRMIRLPKIGWVRMRESLRFAGELLSVVISRDAQRWFAAISARCSGDGKTAKERAHDDRIGSRPAVGVDLGITHLAVLSDGRKIEGPKSLRKNLRRLKRLSRAHSRKQKGSMRRKRAALRLARLHARISNTRRDALHKITTMLARDHAIIGIETLNIKGMMKNRRLSRAIADMGFHEFRRQLEYKALRHGTIIVFADRFYPSSKTCSSCGSISPKMPLSVRNWTCVCDASHDRDINAAVNLHNMAVSFTVSARGAEGSGRESDPPVKPAAKSRTRSGRKREPMTIKPDTGAHLIDDQECSSLIRNE